MAQIIESYIDMAGKYVVRCVIDENESAFFTFTENPSDAELDRRVEIYQLQKQLAELTNTPVQEDAVAQIMSISPRQFDRACLALGLYEQIQGMKQYMTTEQRIDFERATEYRRDNQTLIEMAYAMGKTDADIDAVFALGATFV